MKAARIMAFAGLVALLVASGVPAQAVTTTTVNFDAVVATPAPVGWGSGGMVAGSVRDDYLAIYGITLSDITGTGGGPSDVFICDNYYYGGVLPSSFPNFMTQVGSQGPMSYRMNFASPLEEFGFTRVGVAPGHATPEWWVSAYNSSGGLLDSAHEGVNADGMWSGPATFTLIGPDIAYVVVAGNNYWYAAYESPFMDDIVLTTQVPEPVTMVSVFLAIGSLGAYVRKHSRKQPVA